MAISACTYSGKKYGRTWKFYTSCTVWQPQYRDNKYRSDFKEIWMPTINVALVMPNTNRLIWRRVGAINIDTDWHSGGHHTFARYDLPCSNTKCISNRITDALLGRTTIWYQRSELYLLQTIKCTCFLHGSVLVMFIVPSRLKTKFYCYWVGGFRHKRVIYLKFLELRTCRGTKSYERELWYAGKWMAGLTGWIW